MPETDRPLYERPDLIPDPIQDVFNVEVVGEIIVIAPLSEEDVSNIPLEAEEEEPAMDYQEFLDVIYDSSYDYSDDPPTPENIIIIEPIEFDETM